MKVRKYLITTVSLLALIFNVGCSVNKEEIVVATSVAVTEILDKLGVKISGVPTTTYELPTSTKDAIKVGNPMNQDLEIIKSLNPSIVVSVDTLGEDFKNLFTKNNIPSEFINLSTVDGLKESINTLGRTIIRPFEIPVGLVMSVIGAPFFIYLLRKDKR
ncbi:MAG: iron chelate uptake ABC transporter family permease subunit [Peptostreptococcaceae bacterium]